MAGVSGDALLNDRALHRAERPCRRPRIREFRVKDEVVLVAAPDVAGLLDLSDSNRALSLNRSGCAIWDLCDGNRSVEDIVDVIRMRFRVDRNALRQQVGDALARMARLGFLDGIRSRTKARPGTAFVLGIEDKPYFWWQTAIFLESVRGKLPDGWRTLVVVCNDRAPISDELENIISIYEADYAQGANYDQSQRLDVWLNGGSYYSALNRIEALLVAAGHVDESDMICLLDSDIFLFGDINLDIMPKRCAAPRNWHIQTEPFFSSVAINQGRGVDLAKLLEAIGCDKTFKPGGVNVFVTSAVAKNGKFIADCFRFAQAIFLLGRVAGATNTWMAEMPCFTLAMTANGIAWDLLEQEEFLISSCQESAITAGTFYHYYSDPADFGKAAFLHSKWHKQAFSKDNFLLSDFRQFAADAKTDHEKYFFQLALNARERLYA